MRLGDLSKVYEVGPKGSIRTISSGYGDPGGKSYGLWQLSSKAGTLRKFVMQSKYKDYFNGIGIASSNFDEMWLYLCNKFPDQFEAEQWLFIKKTHFDPVFRYWKSLGYDATRTICQVLWSIGVQHGGFKRVLGRFTLKKNAYKNILISFYDKVADNLSLSEEETVIKLLYEARCNYVDSIGQSGLKVRYRSELKDALDMARNPNNGEYDV